MFSEHFSCPVDNISLGEIEPRTFSFNTPHGACPACTGLGTQMELDPDLVIPNKEQTLAEGAIQRERHRQRRRHVLCQADRGAGAQAQFFDEHPGARADARTTPHDPVRLRDEKIRVKYENQFGQWREYETTYEGVIPNQLRRFKETDSDYIRQEIEQFMTSRPCPVCKGQRLKPEALAVTIADKNIVAVTGMSVTRSARLRQPTA